MTGNVWLDTVSGEYEITPDIVYGEVGGFELKLDLFQHRQESGSDGRANPAVIWYHGGGWVWGDKNLTVLRFLPFLGMGFTVFTVNYRLAKEALAPAAVDDARFAYRWVIAHAEEFNIAQDKIILAGTSAGAHLALMVGMHSEPFPAAIIDFWGIADVDDLIHGPNARPWAMEWIGDTSNHELAAKLSPLSCVQSALPPTLIIHGDPDPDVPFEHSLRLKDALDKAGVSNRLFRYPGGGHGDFSAEDSHHSWEQVRAFLRDHKILR